MNKTHAQPVGPRTVFTLLLLALAGAFSSPSAWGQANANPPERLTYQGYVVDANGNPLGATSPRNYDIIFRIWNDATTTSAANRFWTEQQTVTVDKGYFSVLLGEGASIGEPRPVLSTLFTNATASDRWVGITVKGIGAGTPPADVDILPRIRLLTSPYAFLASKALSVDGAALQSGTVPDARLSGNVSLRSGGNTFGGTQIFNGNVGLGVVNPTNALQVSGVAQVGYVNIQAQDGGNEGGEMFLQGAGVNPNWYLDNFSGRLRMFSSPTFAEHFSLLSNGRLGLGTSSPTTRLDVNGSAAVGYLYIRKGNDTGEGGELVLDGSGTNSFWAIDSWNDGIRTFNDKGLGWVVRGNGNVGIGTVAPQAKLDVNGDIKVKGERPFHFKTYKTTNAVLAVDTGWSTNRYVASIAGFHADTGDILETVSTGTLIQVRAVPSSTGTWRIEADFRTHNDSEDWTVNVMRVVREMVTEDSEF